MPITALGGADFMAMFARKELLARLAASAALSAAADSATRFCAVMSRDPNVRDLPASYMRSFVLQTRCPAARPGFLLFLVDIPCPCGRFLVRRRLAGHVRR